MWKRNYRNYQNSLKEILPTLGPQVRKFFQTPLQLHDGTMVRMEIGDHIASKGFVTRKSLWNQRNARIRLTVLSSTNEFLYEFDYRIIASAKLSFPGAISLFPAGEHTNFGDWGYDELSLSRKGFFRHEILFSSGAMIAVEFQKLAMKKRSLK